jgi:hypothetical protein
MKKRKVTDPEWVEDLKKANKKVNDNVKKIKLGCQKIKNILAGKKPAKVLQEDYTMINFKGKSVYPDFKEVVNDKVEKLAFLEVLEMEKKNQKEEADVSVKAIGAYFLK